MKRYIDFIGLAIIAFISPVILAQSDNPCGAPALAVNATCTATASTTAGATYQNDAANGGTPSCAAPGSPDVWYSFVAPAGGCVSISTTAGTIADGGMALYSGACGSLTQIVCDDDSGPGNMPAISSVTLTPGATYYVRFWRFSSGTGTFNICLTIPPSNIQCLNQTPICSGTPIVFTANSGSGSASSINPGNAYGCLSQQPNPSWYYLEIATGGNLVVNITAASDVDFAIYGPFPNQAAGSAACNSYGTPLDCSYSIAATEQVNLAGVTTGQVYVLLVTNYASVTQNITVSNAGGTATTNCSIVTLPVGYSNWQAYLASDKVRLNWTTESETNSDFFAIQRSTNGTIWETIGFTDAAGNSSSAKSYAFTDEKPIEGINYYRLKQVDLDGHADFTSIIPVEYNVGSPLDAYPNPSTGLVFIKEKGHAIESVSLVDLTGRKRELSFSKGNSGVSVDISEHAKGTYTLQSIDESGSLRSTLLILE